MRLRQSSSVRCVVNFTVLELEPIGAHNPQNVPPYERVEFYVRQDPKRPILLPDMLYTCMFNQHEFMQVGNVMYMFLFQNYGCQLFSFS
jgi:hypothetical protein